jgi:1-acyl-sn-glycerol-3-phosphate acyltransferase
MFMTLLQTGFPSNPMSKQNYKLDTGAEAPAEVPHGDANTQSRIAEWLFVVLRPIHWLFMRLYFRVIVHHPDRIPTSGPIILAPTHRSRWDPILLYCATKRRMRFLTSHDEFFGIQGWFMRRMGAFAVNTERPAPSVLRHCRELLLHDAPLVIFPEGTIFYYPPNQVHPIKAGAAWIAIDAQRKLPGTPLHIVPIRMINSDRYLKFRSTIEIDVREPIPVSHYLDLPVKDAIQALTADLERALGDFVNESIAERVPPRGSVKKKPFRWFLPPVGEGLAAAPENTPTAL